MYMGGVIVIYVAADDYYLEGIIYSTTKLN